MNDDEDTDHGAGNGAAMTLDALAYPFGPRFFLGQLRAFIRDRCPDPTEGLPIVELSLHSGETLELCHVIGLAPSWLAVAVRDEERGGEPTMRTELLPYAAICRVTVRTSRRHGKRMGFDADRHPEFFAAQPTGAGRSAESALRAAAKHPE